MAKLFAARTASNPLMSLTIDGPVNGDTKCSLKQNQTILLGKGTEDYILSLREGILEGYTVGYLVPEMWDREWFFKLGPITPPNQIANFTTYLWLKPETFEKPVDGSDFIASWADTSGSGNNYEQTVTADQPILNGKNSTFNNFRSITAAGTDQVYQHTLPSDFQVDVSAENFASIVFLKTHASSTATQALANLGKAADAGAWRWSIVAGVHLRQHFGATENNRWNTTIAADTSYIIAIGSDDGDAFARRNGTDLGTPTSTTTTSDITSAADQGMILNNDVTTPNQPFLGELFEVIWVKQDDTDSDDLVEAMEKIEGYLAHKYLVTGDLPSDHPYKTNPPRVSPVGI